MDNEDLNGVDAQTVHGRLNRRALMKLGGGAAAMLALWHLQAAQGADNPAMVPADLEKAKQEGTMLLMHGDQESDGVKMVALFTQKTGLPAIQERVSGGAAFAKLEAEIHAGRVDVDVFSCSDIALANQLAKDGQLFQYVSPEMKAYGPKDVSDPIGLWTTYYQNTTPIMYDTSYVNPADAPKTWMDLLDPKWQGQLGFQTSAAGPMYAFWYLLKDILPPDYWDKLAAQKPRGYTSSTQMVSDMQTGSLLIGAATSISQYAIAQASKLPLNVVFPPEGTPSSVEVTMIPKGTTRPNCAKLYIDFLLSADGQKAFAEIKGVPSVRSDVKVPGMLDYSAAKILGVKNFDEYADPAMHAEFVKVWLKVVGA